MASAQADAARAHPLPGFKTQQLLQLPFRQDAVQAVQVVEVAPQAAVAVRQAPDLKCRAWRSSTCYWPPASIRIRNSISAARKPAVAGDLPIRSLVRELRRCCEPS